MMSERVIIGGAVAIFLFLLVRWTAWPANSCEQTITPVEHAVEEIERPVEYFYGIPVDSFFVVQGVIRRNELLGNILHDHGVSDREVYELSLLPRDEFDVRRVKAGNRYALFLDSVGVRYLVYELDRVKYAVVHFDDSVHVESREKPVDVRRMEASGELVTSLWEDFKVANVNPMLALELSEIYAWSIDFFGLQQGDRFKVIYDETFVDSLSVGITRIHAAWFFHSGKEFWAIPFEQDSVLSFFDEEGNSLRKAFLKAPLRFSRISSRFSHSRFHPVLKIRRPHHGVDYAAAAGTPVLAVGDGQVTAAAYERGGGNYVKIKHNGVYNTTYMHLSRFGKGIRKGAWVKQGDVIGYVGSTGLSTGPHLDFRFYKNGAPVDPLKVEAPPVEPIHEENLVDFALVRNSFMAELNNIQ
jgi:murein DD-endopeptidase MepM/ murein hydrolase activator NlpD